MWWSQSSECFIQSRPQVSDPHSASQPHHWSCLERDQDPLLESFNEKCQRSGKHLHSFVTIIVGSIWPDEPAPGSQAKAIWVIYLLCDNAQNMYVVSWLIVHDVGHETDNTGPVPSTNLNTCPSLWWTVTHLLNSVSCFMLHSFSFMFKTAEAARSSRTPQTTERNEKVLAKSQSAITTSGCFKSL